jgi:Zn-dependent alcohol dehydrogenase
MPAVRLLRWQSEPELVAVQVPEPGPGEVLLKVDAGLRHSDLYLTDWPAGTAPCTLPLTLGHETADTVAALGPGAVGSARATGCSYTPAGAAAPAGRACRAAPSPT